MITLPDFESITGFVASPDGCEVNLHVHGRALLLHPVSNGLSCVVLERRKGPGAPYRLRLSLRHADAAPVEIFLVDAAEGAMTSNAIIRDGRRLELTAMAETIVSVDSSRVLVAVRTVAGGDVSFGWFWVEPLETSAVSAAKPGDGLAAQLMHKLHGGAPYEELTELRPLDIQGWNSEDPSFEQLISDVRPHSILEVGTWKGASALHMARVCDGLALSETPIVCVDTWLGALEFWTNPTSELHAGLRTVAGYPSVYHTFASNVVQLKQGHRIIPLPLPSLTAARLLLAQKLQFNMIYIDASHEEVDVREDCRAFWPLVAPGGVLFGDDYGPFWPGVVAAVDGFVARRRLPLEVRGEKWIVRKAPNNPRRPPAAREPSPS